MVSLIDDLVCPVCGKKESSALYRKEETLSDVEFSYHILRCDNCRHLFSSPLPQQVFDQSGGACGASKEAFLNDLETTNKKIRSLNSPWRRFILREYLGYKKEAPKKGLKYLCALFLSRLTSGNILPFHKDGRILDVGCNNGLYLYLLKSIGWQVWGIEVDRDACELGKELGIDIFRGRLEDAGFSEAFFDVVRFNQVLEHIPDVKNVIKEAKRILKKDGRIYISVPNARSFAFFLFKEAWLNTVHIHGFSPSSIKYLCEEEGLKIISIRFSSSKSLIINGVNHFFKSRGSSFFLKNRFILRMAAGFFSFILNILRVSDTLSVEAENEAE